MCSMHEYVACETECIFYMFDEVTIIAYVSVSQK